MKQRSLYNLCFLCAWFGSVINIPIPRPALFNAFKTGVDTTVDAGKGSFNAVDNVASVGSNKLTSGTNSLKDIKSIGKQADELADSEMVADLRNSDRIRGMKPGAESIPIEPGSLIEPGALKKPVTTTDFVSNSARYDIKSPNVAQNTEMMKRPVISRMLFGAKRSIRQLGLKLKMFGRRAQYDIEFRRAANTKDPNIRKSRNSQVAAIGRKIDALASALDAIRATG